MNNYKIAVAGTGYVGLSIATLLSQHHQVTAVDVIPEKVELINGKKSPIQDEYIEKYLAEKDLNLTATLDGASAYRDADFVVIAAPTNYDPNKNFFDTSHVEEVIDLVSFYYTTYGISFFNIHDDDFTSPKRFTREFCRRVIELKQRGGLPPQMAFFCQSRVVDFLDLKTRQPDMEILRLMKAAGFHRISFGVENFSEKMLLTPIMHKKGYDDAVIMELLRAARRLDIESGVNFMICVPEAEPEDVRLNLERLVDVQEMNGIAIMNMYIQSYPGSFAFGNPRYPAVTSQHVSPLNGWEYVKQKHFIPHHPRVRDALAYYMECGVRDAVAAYKQQYPNVHVQEMKMLNLIKANVMARHLGFDGLVARLEKSIQQRAAFLKTQGN